MQELKRCQCKGLIESDWNLKYFAAIPDKVSPLGLIECRLEFKGHPVVNMYSVQTGLIESDWNLKWLCQGLLCLHLQGINRIRLEFKEIIVKGDPAVFVRINRIRLEFKGVSDSG